MTTIIVCLGIIVSLILFMVYNACRAGSNTSRDEEWRELERQYHIINSDDV